MSEKIKIAYLDYSEVFAGAEQVLHTMISSIDRTKFEPILVFPYPREHQARFKDLDCEKYFLADGLKWWMGHYRWKHPLRGTDLLARTIWGIKLAMLLKRLHVDILHVNLLRPDCLMWLLLSHKMGIKVIGHFRSYSVDKRWVPMPIVQRQCDLVLCVSQYCRDFFLLRGEHCKSQVLYDCINTNKFSNRFTEKCQLLRKLGFEENTVLITSVGQLSPHKGHGNAIIAFANIAHKYPKAKLFIAGSGSQFQKLKVQIDSYPNLKDRIVMTGQQYGNIDEIYYASDLILSLTNEGEAFGLVPYEAALCGVPCIAPEFGAIIEFLKDGKSGLLVNTCNVDAITSKMDWALSHPEETTKMVAEANKIINERLIPSVMVVQLSKVYFSMAHKS